MQTDPPKQPPAHLVECKTPEDVKAWLKVHCDTWHYGQVLAGCALCELALVRLADLK